MKISARKAKKHLRKGRILLAAVLVLVAAGPVCYAVARAQHQRAVNQERAQFAQAEKDLDATSAKIIAKFGQPEQNIKSKNCGYTSSFSSFTSRGDLYCYIETLQVYAVSDLDASRALAGEIETFSIGSRQFETDTALSLDNTVPPVDVGYDTYKIGSLSCSTIYKYFLSSNNLKIVGYPKLANISSGQALLIDTQCSSRSATAPIFPLTD